MEALGFTVSRWETDRGVHEIATREARGAATGLVRRYAGYSERAEDSRRREVARPGIALILGLGDPLAVSYEEAGAATAFGAFVVGNHTRPAWTGFSGRQHGVQVDLTPAGAYALLGDAIDDLTDRVVPLDAVLGREGVELLERLAESPSWSARFGLLDHVIGDHRDRPPLSREVRWLWQQLAACHGDARVETLLGEVGWSRRHLARRFRQQIGLAPKAYARLLRFQHLVDCLQSRPAGSSLADIAVAAGYYDQAHLNRDFRAFAGCTPTQYLSESDPDPQVRFVQDDEREALIGSPS